MDNRYYEPIPCGVPLPLDTPHAFSVSMPTYQDVVDYESEINNIFDRIRTAYPRIITHPFIKQAIAHIKAELDISSGVSFLLPSMDAAFRVASLSKTEPMVFLYESYALVHFPEKSEDNPADFYSFMKHCGYMIFSREAYTFLRMHEITVEPFKEIYCSSRAEQRILDVLAQGYGSQEITLTNCGMNAIWAAYMAVRDQQGDRDIFVQFGWLYTDSIHILRKVSGEFKQIGKVDDLAELALFCQENGSKIAAILTETVSNPLLHAPDLNSIYALSKEHGFLVILDNTFATPWNVAVSDYCDIIVESLTKFASGKGDCMSGAIIIPDGSRLGEVGRETIREMIVPLEGRDLQRLAAEIEEYRERMVRINGYTKQVVEALQGDTRIELYHVFHGVGSENYRAIAHDESCYGGVISFVPVGDFASFYDNLNLPKGPSLGADFPLVMPYTLLAHWDLVNEPDQKTLKSIGLSPWMLRLSVGDDDPLKTINAIRKALDCMK